MFRSLLILLAAGSLVTADEARGGKMRVYVGTYTGAKSKGIYRAQLDLETGTLSGVTLAGEATNPSFLSIHPSQKFLYAVGENPGKGGAVSAFAIDEKTGALKLLNQHSSKGAGPCHISLDRTGKTALVANYGGGSVAALAIKDDGSLMESSSFHKHEGPSQTNKGRQKAAYAHSINVDPGNKFAFAADLGCDRIFAYQLDPEKATLTPHDPKGIAVAPGSGPRHFAFHPSGKYAYVINEMLLTVTAFKYDGDKGVLETLQTITTLPGESKPSYSTAEVVVHPSGKFLYGSNRGHNSIVIFKIDEGTGKLTAVGHQSKSIRTPRNFAIDPTGKFLLVANQDGDSISVFRIAQKTGELELVGEPVETQKPVCIRFVPVK